MKQIISIAILCFYLAVSAVSAISLHYCHGNLVDFSINTPAESCCDTTEHEKSCCNNIQVEIDLEEDQVSSNSLRISEIKSFVIFTSILSEDVLDSSDVYQPNTLHCSSPPDDNLTELYLIHRSFLFYG